MLVNCESCLLGPEIPAAEPARADLDIRARTTITWSPAEAGGHVTTALATQGSNPGLPRLKSHLPCRSATVTEAARTRGSCIRVTTPSTRMSWAPARRPPIESNVNLCYREALEVWPTWTVPVTNLKRDFNLRDDCTWLVWTAWVPRTHGGSWQCGPRQAPSLSHLYPWLGLHSINLNPWVDGSWKEFKTNQKIIFD